MTVLDTGENEITIGPEVSLVYVVVTEPLPALLAASVTLVPFIVITAVEPEILKNVAVGSQ